MGNRHRLVFTANMIPGVLVVNLGWHGSEQGKVARYVRSAASARPLVLFNVLQVCMNMNAHTVQYEGNLTVIKSLYIPSDRNTLSWSGMSAAPAFRNGGFPPRLMYKNIGGEMAFHPVSNIRQTNHQCMLGYSRTAVRVRTVHVPPAVFF